VLELPFSEDRYVRRHWPLIAKLREALRDQRRKRSALARVDRFLEERR